MSAGFVDASWSLFDVLSLTRSFVLIPLPLRAAVATACLAGGIACTHPVVPVSLLPDLENRFGRVQLAADAPLDGIIVLGGGSTRMIEAVRLAKLYPEAHLLISGSGEQYWHEYAIESGISPARLLTEERSTNTHENAAYSSLLVGAARTGRWLLVTSAAHMPRAMGAFRKAGFNPLAWPVNSTPLRPGSIRHEWLGLVAYWVTGRTNELLPAPDTTTQLEQSIAHSEEQGSSDNPAGQAPETDRKSL